MKKIATTHKLGVQGSVSQWYYNTPETFDLSKKWRVRHATIVHEIGCESNNISSVLLKYNSAEHLCVCVHVRVCLCLLMQEL